MDLCSVCILWVRLAIIAARNVVWGGNVFNRDGQSVCSWEGGMDTYGLVQSCSLGDPSPPPPLQHGPVQTCLLGTPLLTCSNLFTMLPIHLSASGRLAYDCKVFLQWSYLFFTKHNTNHKLLTVVFSLYMNTFRVAIGIPARIVNE